MQNEMKRISAMCELIAANGHLSGSNEANKIEIFTIKWNGYVPMVHIFAASEWRTMVDA